MGTRYWATAPEHDMSIMTNELNSVHPPRSTWYPPDIHWTSIYTINDSKCFLFLPLISAGILYVVLSTCTWLMNDKFDQLPFINLTSIWCHVINDHGFQLPFWRAIPLLCIVADTLYIRTYMFEHMVEWKKIMIYTMHHFLEGKLFLKGVFLL